LHLGKVVSTNSNNLARAEEATFFINVFMLMVGDAIAIDYDGFRLPVESLGPQDRTTLFCFGPFS
jgi:hypothetical protein